MFNLTSDLRFWGDEFWIVYPGFSPDVLPSSVLTHFKATISALLSTLQSNAPTTMSPILDAFAASGGLRVGMSVTAPAAWLSNNLNGAGNAAYVLFDPSRTFYAFNASGKVFEVSSSVILAHELGHSTGKADVFRDLPGGYTSDSAMNSATFDHVGETLRFEQKVSSELGLNETRVSYLAGFVDGDKRLDYLDRSIDYTKGQSVSIVRLGDQIGGDAMNNEIDFSSYSKELSVLALGFRGDDIMKGSGGIDHFWGGVGKDSLKGNGGNDYLYGEGDSDNIEGGDGSDRIYGGESNDVIDGGGGDDFIYGDMGSIQSDNTTFGDKITGGLGFDVLSFAESGVVHILFENGVLRGQDNGTESSSDEIQGIEKIIGSNFDDIIYANDSGMELDGGEGSDELHGGSGQDKLIGGGGWDSLYGEGGNDELSVYEGFLDGGTGDDTLVVTGGGIVEGGSGNDTITTSGGDVRGGAGNDIINSKAMSLTSYFDAGDGSDTINLVDKPKDGLYLISSIDKSQWSLTYDIKETTVELLNANSDIANWMVGADIILVNGQDSIRINNVILEVFNWGGSNPFFEEAKLDGISGLDYIYYGADSWSAEQLFVGSTPRGDPSPFASLTII